MIVRVLLCRPKMRFPFIAWLIMIFQGMKPWNRLSYSHMALDYYSCVNTQRVIDATGSHGVNNQIFRRFIDKYDVVKSFPLKVDITHDCLALWSDNEENKIYDYSGVIGLLLKNLGLVKKNPFGNNWRRMTCNEIVLSFIKRFYSHNIGDPDNYDLVMTEDLLVSIIEEQRKSSC